MHRLLAKWKDRTISHGEYAELLSYLPNFSHREMVFILSGTLQDRLRDEVRQEMLMRSVMQSPREKLLIWTAIILGIASSIATIANAFK